MAVSPDAGTPAPADQLIDVDALIAAYHDDHPDPAEPSQRVSFGTSGHRGSAARLSFNADHITAITQAICEYRVGQGIRGPMFIGIDTHALSAPALGSALEVLGAYGVDVRIAPDGQATPTPVVSHAILRHNRERAGAGGSGDGKAGNLGNRAGRGGRAGLADGIVITPSHNPPADGGFKYNPPSGGPAGTATTTWIQDRANALLTAGVATIRRIPYPRAREAATVHDFLSAYVDDLPTVVDLDAARSAGPRIGVDPLGGSSLEYWQAIAERHKLDIDIVNTTVDPRFGFMTRDWDGKIRMDPSSPYAMASLLRLKDRYDVALANDTDADRHGIVTASAGLLNPNHYLSVAISHLFTRRPGWPGGAAVGKTLVSSGMIDRVAAAVGRTVVEVPVGFKWFVDGLLEGSLGFGGEESAGASFLRRDGSVWTTDKDGIIACLLAAEITAVAGKDPGALYAELTERHGQPAYRRIDAPATSEQKAVLAALTPRRLDATTLAGQPVTGVLTHAPGNGAAIGGVKVTASGAWFAARPSGTEDVYKIYAESFHGEEHLGEVLREAQALVDGALAAG
jgi:phosphoglucomutase